MMIQEQLLTSAQVANHLQIQERTVTRWLRDGYLRGSKLGKEWRIAPSDLQDFIERNAQSTTGVGKVSQQPRARIGDAT